MMFDANNQNLLNTIEHWRIELAKPNQHTDLRVFAFFKIYIQFERFLNETFSIYAAGGKSEFKDRSGVLAYYTPTRNLNFTENSLKIVVRKEEKDGVQVLDRLKNDLSGQYPWSFIFTAKDASGADINPFRFLEIKKIDVELMFLLRNHIAHESSVSKKLFTDKVCAEFSMPKPNNPSELLNKKLTTSQITLHSGLTAPATYYDFYIFLIKNISNSLINPQGL
jgi:hypothetical protein